MPKQQVLEPCQEQHQGEEAKEEAVLRSELDVGGVAAAQDEPPLSVVAISPALPSDMAREAWHVSDFEFGKRLYTGYASSVYRATCNRSGRSVVLKLYQLDQLPDLNRHQVLREVRIHARLHHPHIVQLYAALAEEDTLVLVQEDCDGGDLYQYMHRVGWRLSERDAVSMVITPLCLALRYLHARGIMHRDIKLENVLLTGDRTVKLGDFGLAIDLNQERAVTRAGTLDYMAPEVHLCPLKSHPAENKGAAYLHYGPAVDSWALGVLGYELMSGCQPFEGLSKVPDAMGLLMSSRVRFPESMSQAARAFISAALKKHPGDRPTADEMLMSPLLAAHGRSASLQRELCPGGHATPNARPGASGGACSTAPSTPTKANAAGGGGGGAAAPVALAAATCGDHAPLGMIERYPSAPRLLSMLPVEELDAMVEALQAAKAHALENQARHEQQQGEDQHGWQDQRRLGEDGHSQAGAQDVLARHRTPTKSRVQGRSSRLAQSSRGMSP